MSLFAKSQTTSGLFSQGGLQPAGPITTGPSLFSSITGNQGGLFNQGSNPTGSLFSQTPGSLFSNPPQPGSLFTAQASFTSGTPSLSNQAGTGGLFAQPSSSTGGLFSQNPPQSTLFNSSAPTNASTGLFSQNSTGLFAQNPPTSTSSFPQTGGLFSSNTTGLFSQNPTNPTGGLFSNPTGPGLFSGPPGGLFSQNPAPGGLFSQNPTNVAQPINYSPQENPSSQLIENVSPSVKEAFYNLRKIIDDNDNNLAQSETHLLSILKYKDELKQRLTNLFIFSRKVQTAEKRCKITMDIIKRFQGNINNFIKDAVKVFNQCEHADSFHQIESPAGFLVEMLAGCEERLKCIEENFKEVQELMALQSSGAEANMLVNTLVLMQEKFELVSGVAYDVHRKVLELLQKHGVVVVDTEKKQKINKVETENKFSSIKDIIAGRPVYPGYH